MSIRKIYDGISNPGETLTRRVIHGGFWSFSLRMANRGLTFMRTIILARLLSPNDFGLFGIAMLALAALEQFSITGFDKALVQKSGNIDDYLDTVWVVQITRGFIIGLVLVLAAPIISRFFGEPRVVMLMRVLGIAIFIGSLKNIGVVFFRKNLEFHKEFVYMFSGTMADFVVALTAAFLLKNAWALIFGFLARNLVQFVVSYFIHSYRPRFRIEWEKAKDLFGFGKWVLGSSILVFLLTQGDDIFVGKLLGVVSLGLYQVAYKISNLPATEITHVISRITFPAYSKLQDNIENLRKAYLDTIQLIAFFSFLIGGLIFILAGDFVVIFIGDKWLPMVSSVMVLVVYASIRSIGAATGPLFQAVGRPQISTNIQIGKLILLVAIIYPLSARWGILGTSWAILIDALVFHPIAEYMVIRITKANPLRIIKLLGLPIIASAITVLSLSGIEKYLLISTNLLFFILKILLGISIYFLITFLFVKIFDYRLLSLIKYRYRKFKGQNIEANSQV
ncbi:lipopolysaccharide biosynthesis protein [bacterium]|nr:MAG: lipopolysaccharide biosynthesis protein [bacterium]